MRRVGVNTLVLSSSRTYGRCVVELYDDRVCNYYPIDPDNLDMCEWIGGTIFLTALESHEILASGTVDDLVQCLESCTDYPTKAYHLPSKIFKQGVFQLGQLIQLTDEED